MSEMPAGPKGRALSSIRPLRGVALVMLAACSMGYRGRPRVAPIAMVERSSTESYRDWGKNPWVDASVDHLSTFAADVDTASYTIARRKLNEGTLPPPASVRVEELVNYFRYAFPPPSDGSPFTVAMDAAPSPFVPDSLILRVGVATQPRPAAERPPAHLVFLVDVSGSMVDADKLPLAKRALTLLTQNLTPRDTVSLVTYAGSTRVVLPPTSIDRASTILAAIDELGAGGATAMASGLDLAYEQAMRMRAPGAISRVIVCTDGDTNVGATRFASVLQVIAARAKEGVTLSTIGFGMGNYKDDLMEQLADKGNGNNFYIDTFDAAKRVFQDQLGATLEVVARDAKLQVDFDPSVVARYRLLGYENRDVADNDFRNDAVDGGEIGPGHQVTAMYEVALTPTGHAKPLGLVRIRYQGPEGGTAMERAYAMASAPAAAFAQGSADLRFAFAVAAFADVLRGQKDAQAWSLATIAQLARDAAGDDRDRLELVGLVEKARELRGPSVAVAR